jgi:hypothetical protein
MMTMMMMIIIIIIIIIIMLADARICDAEDTLPTALYLELILVCMTIHLDNEFFSEVIYL